MFYFVFLHLMYLVSVEGKIGANSPILTEIEPFITANERIFRIGREGALNYSSEIDDNQPSIVLQFKPNFFDHPQLKQLYSSLIGLTDKNYGLNKVFQAPSKNVEVFKNILFRIQPSEYHATKGSNGRRENQVSYQLDLNPAVPRKPLCLSNYKVAAGDRFNWCNEMQKVTSCCTTEPSSVATTQCRPQQPDPLISDDRQISDECHSPSPCEETNRNFNNCAKENDSDKFSERAVFTNNSSSASPKLAVVNESSLISKILSAPNIFSRVKSLTNETNKVPLLLTLPSQPGKYFILVKRSSRWPLLHNKMKLRYRRKIKKVSYRKKRHPVLRSTYKYW